MTDLVQWTLEAVNRNWQDTNYQPKPILYHDEDKRRFDTNRRTKKEEFSENNIVTVGSQPTGTNDPLGFEFAYRNRSGVTVKIEGVHTDRGGHIADANDFKDGLVAEVSRTINVERSWPTGLRDDGIHTAYIAEVDNQSTQSMNAYRIDLTVNFRGYVRLPESPIAR